MPSSEALARRNTTAAPMPTPSSSKAHWRWEPSAFGSDTAETASGIYEATGKQTRIAGIVPMEPPIVLIPPTRALPFRSVLRVAPT